MRRRAEKKAFVKKKRRKLPKRLHGSILCLIFVVPKPRERELSSAGSERLPYKQRVGGSNPSAPTSERRSTFDDVGRLFFVSAAEECRRSEPSSSGGCGG